MKRIKSIGYGICLLFALSLFLSEKFENNVLIPLLLVLFLISISFDKDRENIFVFKEKKISYILCISGIEYASCTVS